MGGGISTGLANTNGYRFSNIKHQALIGRAFDLGGSYQHGFSNGYHLEGSVINSNNVFYENQSYLDTKTNQEYLITGWLEYYALRLTLSFGKEIRLNDNWIYSFSAGPIFDYQRGSDYAVYSMIDHDNPANSEYYVQSSYFNTDFESGFNDFLKLSIQNKLYLNPLSNSLGGFVNIQTLYLGKAKYPLLFDHPGFWGISNVLQLGITKRF